MNIYNYTRPSHPYPSPILIPSASPISPTLHPCLLNQNCVSSLIYRTILFFILGESEVEVGRRIGGKRFGNKRYTRLRGIPGVFEKKNRINYKSLVYNRPFQCGIYRPLRPAVTTGSLLGRFSIYTKKNHDLGLN